MKRTRTTVLYALLLTLPAVLCADDGADAAEQSVSSRETVSQEEPSVEVPRAPEETEAPAFEEIRQLTDFLRRWEEDEEILGERRLRRLEIARYHLASQDFGRDLDDDPIALGETEDILRSCVAKILRERLLRSVTAGVDFDLDRLAVHSVDEDDDEDTRPRLRVSPRLGSSYVGAKLSLRNAGERWQRWSLGYRQNVDGGRQRVTLDYAGERWDLHVEHQARELDDGGDQVAFRLRRRF